MLSHPRAHPRGPPEGPTRRAPRPTRGAQVGGPTLGPSGWAHVGPTWVGPRGAQTGWAHVGPKVGGPTWGPSGPKPEIWDPKKSKKLKILKIKIRSAQNVGKVFLSRIKTFPAPFGALPSNFLHRPEKCKKIQNFAYFPWWANGPYSPGWGAAALRHWLKATPVETVRGSQYYRKENHG